MRYAILSAAGKAESHHVYSIQTTGEMIMKDSQQGNYQQGPGMVHENRGNGLGVAALVVGIVALVFSWVPFLNVVALPPALVGFCLGVAGLVFGAVKKRSKGMSVAGIVLSVVSIAVFAAMNTAAVDVIDKTYEAKGPASLEEAAEESEEKAGEASEKQAIAIATPTNTAKFEILVNGSSVTDRIENGSYLYFEADAGNEYVVVNVTLKNISDKMETFNTGDFKLLSDDGSVQYSPSNLITASKEMIPIADSLNPGTEKQGNIVFELPSGVDTSSLKLKYNDSWSLDSNEYFFKIA